MTVRTKKKLSSVNEFNWKAKSDENGHVLLAGKLVGFSLDGRVASAYPRTVIVTVSYPRNF